MATLPTVRVIYADTDQMGVVYYGNYLRYFEIGRIEWLRSRGHNYKDFEAQGVLLPVIEAHASYRAPARYDDLLTIEARLVEARRVSVRFAYRLTREDGLLIAEGYTVHAAVGRDGRPRRLPPELAEFLGREVVAP